METREHTRKIDTSNLDLLSRMDNFKVASGNPDVRGWDVIAKDGRKLGKVDHLLVDRDARKVRYLGLNPDRGLLSGSEHRHYLIPVEDARLDRSGDNVKLNTIASNELLNLTAYDMASFDRSPRIHERGNLRETGPDTGRTEPRGNERERMTLSEEELAVGKRRAAAGEVEIDKRVETERVRRDVPVTREDVTVERRPATGQSTSARIEEDEIHIPLMREEAVVEKRTVPKEEIVVKKHTKTETEPVEATVRKERAEVHRTGDVEERTGERTPRKPEGRL